MQKKRHHHYVWRYYLRPWSSNGKIVCLREGKIFKSELMGVGQKRDFYKLNELNNKDFAFIKRLAIDSSPKHLQSLHTALARQFNIVFQLRKHIASKGVNDPKLDNLLDVAIHNLEEEMHTGIESTAIKYIESILREDISFYDADKGCRDFLYFLCTQHMRTEKIRKSVIKSIGQINGIEFEKVWNVLSHIFATNMAWNFYAKRERFKMVLLKNQTVKEIITGDQPVTNTYADIGGMGKTPPESVELYYPVSPRIAILMSEKEEYQRDHLKILNEHDVISYNKMIIRNSHSQVYGTSIDVLQEYNC